MWRAGHLDACVARRRGESRVATMPIFPTGYTGMRACSPIYPSPRLRQRKHPLSTRKEAIHEQQPHLQPSHIFILSCQKATPKNYRTK